MLIKIYAAILDSKSEAAVLPLQLTKGGEILTFKTEVLADGYITVEELNHEPAKELWKTLEIEADKI